MIRSGRYEFKKQKRKRDAGLATQWCHLPGHLLILFPKSQRPVVKIMYNISNSDDDDHRESLSDTISFSH